MVLIYPQGFGTPNTLYTGDAIEGMLADAYSRDFVTPNLINNGNLLNQITTIAPGTPADSTAYSITVAGVYDTAINNTVAYTSDADATAAEIAAGLMAAIQADSILYGVVAPTVDGSDNLVLTFRNKGKANSYTVTLGGGGIGYAATATQAAADSEVIPFGRVVATSTTSADYRTAKLPTVVGDVVRGVCVRTDAHEITQTGVDGVNPSQMVNALSVGRIWVKPTTAFSPSDTVYYSYASGSEGTVGNANPANTAELVGAKFENAGSVGEFAILRVNF